MSGGVAIILPNTDRWHLRDFVVAKEGYVLVARLEGYSDESLLSSFCVASC